MIRGSRSIGSGSVLSLFKTIRQSQQQQEKRKLLWQHHQRISSSSHKRINHAFFRNSGRKNATAAAAATTATAAIVLMSSFYSSDDAFTTCSNSGNHNEKNNVSPMLSESERKASLGTSSATIQNNLKEEVPAPTTTTTNKNDNSKDRETPDDFPKITRYHRSLLAKHLTPSIWSEVRDRRTSKGVTIEQIIQSGTSLPFGCDPPRGIGVLAGDAESYRVFAPLMIPIIRDFHGIETQVKEKKAMAKPKMRKYKSDIHSTHIITKKNPDPTGDHILSVRISLSRCIDGFAFPSTINRKDRRIVESLVKDATESLTDENAEGGAYIPIYSMTNEQNEDLIRRNILFQNPVDWYISAGSGRDWPDGRGVYVN
eukprot:14313515-Ditylum_brightwellii.AAC.1